MKGRKNRMRDFRRCAVCNKLYIATRQNAKYCSADCRLEGTYAMKRTYKERKEQKAKPKKLKKSITDIAVEARQAGMTYGQYVAKMGL